MANSKTINIAYNVFENAEGSDVNLTPVIFLHGMLCSKEMWNDIPQAVADQTKRKVYVCDARNHGESDYTDEFNYYLNVDDLFSFMDERNIPKAILVGHSMGGRTCIMAALQKPERVEMIFPVDAAFRNVQQETVRQMVQYTSLFINILQNIPKDTPESEIMDTVVNQLFKDSTDDFDFEKEKESMKKLNFQFKRKADGSYAVPFNANAILKFVKEGLGKTIVPEGQFKGPVYYIYGTKSNLQLHKYEDIIKQQFPEAELIPFEGSSHQVHIDFPEKFIQTLVEHL